MVATHKHDPIVRLPHSLVVAIEDTLVIPFLFETEPAITSNDCKDRKILLILQMEIEKREEDTDLQDIVLQNEMERLRT